MKILVLFCVDLILALSVPVVVVGGGGGGGVVLD